MKYDFTQCIICHIAHRPWQHFKNEISLKVRQGTVLHFRINTNFVCSKRLRKLRGFYNSVYNSVLSWPVRDVANYALCKVILHFSSFLILINFQRHMNSICVWNMIKQSNPLQTRYNTTNIYDRYYIRTHVYVFHFSVKKRVFELSRVWPWRWPCGGTQNMVFIGPVFH